MKILASIGNWRKIASPDCESAAFLMSCRKDRELPAPHRFFLGVHLLLCRHCRRYRDHLAFLSAAAAGYNDQIPRLSARQLSPEARERIQKKLLEIVNNTPNEPQP